MKPKHILASILCCMIWFTAYSTESEPNGSVAQANNFSLNGSNSGNISPAGEVDWWKITTNADGKLTITWTSTNGVNVSAYLYDHNGTTLLVSGNTTGSTSMFADGLAVGTYYLRMQCYYGSESGGYSMSNALTLPPVAIDAEPNGTKALAVTLTLNSSTNGHIGYYYNLAKDTFDWYKVITNADGRLRLTMQSLNGQNVSWYLYANNGTTLITSNTTTATAITNSDGLAAGTYYIRINNYYGNEWSPYTLSDSLFPPAIANDVEPNGTKATAKTLGLNSSKNGHIGYSDMYALRDTFDWYKVTTNADGRLRLTMQSFNGQNVSWYLFDNNGTSLLASFNTTATAILNKDGLGAGTYYIRVNTYFGNEFAPYTLSDSLFVPAQANDAEPNDTKAQALSLTLNSTATGHTGYTYNQVRDGYDWYQLVLPNDGNLQLTIASNNGQNVSCYLYDNDGTTQLNYINTTASSLINTDGLQAGTYYIRINNYYSNEWAPYTLTNNLQVYSYNSDLEPNNYATRAKTMNVNAATTGHVGFYYNLTRDGVDWWKVNYTGTGGTVTLNINQEAHLSNGAYANLSIYVYKDTSLSYNFYQNSTAASWSLNLTGLTQGYFWIRVTTYYSNEFVSYSINPSFTQTNCVTSVSATTTHTGSSCTNSYITFKVTGGINQYLQLYRYGIAQGGKVAADGTGSHKFDNLSPGNYYAIGFSDGATGGCQATSATATVVPKPKNLTATNITSTTADINWTVLSCVKYYFVQSRVQGTSSWKKKTTVGNAGTYHLTGLSPNTIYEYRVAANDSANGQTANGKYSAISIFGTLARLEAPEASGQQSLTAYPNPASSNVHVNFENGTEGEVTMKLFDVTGKIVFARTENAASGNLDEVLDLTDLNPGVYQLQVITADGSVLHQSIVRVKE